jgi:hypothetical protein
MITSKNGSYKVFSYQFDDISLQKLTTEIILWKKDINAEEKSRKDTGAKEPA